jgi:hypothetical protein
VSRQGIHLEWAFCRVALFVYVGRHFAFYLMGLKNGFDFQRVYSICPHATTLAQKWHKKCQIGNLGKHLDSLKGEEKAFFGTLAASGIWHAFCN